MLSIKGDGESEWAPTKVIGKRGNERTHEDVYIDFGSDTIEIKPPIAKKCETAGVVAVPRTSHRPPVAALGSHTATAPFGAPMSFADVDEPPQVAERRRCCRSAVSRPNETVYRQRFVPHPAPDLQVLRQQRTEQAARARQGGRCLQQFSGAGLFGGSPLLSLLHADFPGDKLERLRCLHAAAEARMAASAPTRAPKPPQDRPGESRRPHTAPAARVQCAQPPPSPPPPPPSPPPPPEQPPPPPPPHPPPGEWQPRPPPPTPPYHPPPPPPAWSPPRKRKGRALQVVQALQSVDAAAHKKRAAMLETVRRLSVAQYKALAQPRSVVGHTLAPWLAHGGRTRVTLRRRVHRPRDILPQNSNPMR